MTMIFGTTPWQTVGPFFDISLPWERGSCAVAETSAGAITISGALYDGGGEPMPDGLIETWQADPAGRFDQWMLLGVSCVRLQYTSMRLSATMEKRCGLEAKQMALEEGRV